MNDGGSAFPLNHSIGVDCADGLDAGYYGLASYGMTLRDWFAGMVMVGYHANPDCDAGATPAQDARYCYLIADAMLAERDKKADDGEASSKN